MLHGPPITIKSCTLRPCSENGMRGSLVLTENAGSRLYGQLRVIQLLLGKILKVGWSGFRGGFRVWGLGLKVKGVEVGGQICLGSMLWGLGSPFCGRSSICMALGPWLRASG